ncbi:COQ9 family protein [Frigidibacter sp. SD6-1]|uniref:COQ9 family protein n=1 Tax=Frigidibacter sp. SD6-1 TaxID=3032581 RepID=UPI0024E00B62|nr:COQ9 family protein [Frigidibacter sp. SD6-1]
MSRNSSEIPDDRAGLFEAALPHVVFDGWSDACFTAACADAGIDPALGRVLCPAGARDLAADYHRAGDRAMEARLAEIDLAGLRFRERVVSAVRFRLQAADRELVRKGAALFALPQNAGRGAELIWGTADAIWRALGDTSTDVNWYTKRASLSAVYGSTVLYWLGDESEGYGATWAFLDRRIEDVMRFEKAKADFRASPWAKLFAVPLKGLEAIRAPGPSADDLPGRKD